MVMSGGMNTRQDTTLTEYKELVHYLMMKLMCCVRLICAVMACGDLPSVWMCFGCELLVGVGGRSSGMERGRKE